MKKFIIVTIISVGLLLSAAMQAVAIHDDVESNHFLPSVSSLPL